MALNGKVYCTGSGKAISYNTPPVISGSDQNMGAKTDPSPTNTPSPTPIRHPDHDRDGNLTNGAETITLRTYTATAGAQNTADLSSVWIRLIAGTHVLKITASDGAGGTAVRNITFSRTVTRIAAPAPSTPTRRSRRSSFPCTRPTVRPVPRSTWK